jgi:hypothetical protein
MVAEASKVVMMGAADNVKGAIPNCTAVFLRDGK